MKSEYDSIRRALLLSGMTLATGFAGGAGLGLARQFLSPVTPKLSKWSFLQDPTIKEWDDIAIPFGTRSQLLPGAYLDQLVVQSLPHLRDHTSSGRSTIGREWSLGTAYSQNVIVPCGKHYGKSQERYCKSAIEYLYRNLRGLDQSYRYIVWSPTFEGMDLSKHRKRSAYICRKWVNEVMLVFVDKRNRSQQINITHSNERNGAQAVIYPYIDNFEIIVTQGSDAVGSPFSEVIPLSTIKRSSKAFWPDKKKIIEADETIAEGLSYHLSRNIIYDMKIPLDMGALDEGVKAMMDGPPQYRHLSKSINWIARHGMQRAFDTYMANPLDFMQRIDAV